MSYRQIYEITSGMSEMAAKHPNDTISCALARLSDKINGLGEKLASYKFTEAERALITYYHQNKDK